MSDWKESAWSKRGAFSIQRCQPSVQLQTYSSRDDKGYRFNRASVHLICACDLAFTNVKRATRKEAHLEDN